MYIAHSSLSEQRKTQNVDIFQTHVSMSMFRNAFGNLFRHLPFDDARRSAHYTMHAEYKREFYILFFSNETTNAI